MATVTDPIVVRRWHVPVLIGAFYLAAGYLNAGPLLAGTRPSIAGMAASAGYGAAWLGQAFVAGRCNSCRTMRVMAGFWAVVIACAVICTTFVRLDARSGIAGSGWVMAALVATAAPLYGLAGAFSGDPLTWLTAVSAATGALTLALAAMARKRATAAT